MIGPLLSLSLPVLTIALAIGVGKYVIWPGYLDQRARIYTSRLGYAAVMRSQNKPFPVVTTSSSVRRLTQQFMGEGVIRSEPVLVPIVPMGRITKVHVGLGERVARGQLLAEIDDEQARIKVAAAKAALAIAKAELERIRIGSDYLLEQERPDREKIRVTAAQELSDLQNRLDIVFDRLYEKKLISKQELLRRKMDNVETVASLREAKLSLERSKAGREQSIRIAEVAVYEAQLAIAHRESEWEKFKIYAPADGLIERCLVHEGEYNQDPGKPAFLIASGQWFEAHFDQTAISQIQPGDKAVVQLEAFAGDPVAGRVSLVSPVVTYGNRGPESNRSIRPLGTGTPEWPSTFTVRIALEDTSAPIALGLTGFCRVEKTKQAPSLPVAAVTSVTSSHGIVCVVGPDNKTFERRKVQVGHESDGWIEIRDGLAATDQVIVEGHRVLELGDQITVTDFDSPSNAKPPTGEVMVSFVPKDGK